MFDVLKALIGLACILGMKATTRRVNLLSDSNALTVLRRLVPPLTNGSHKGQAGRIGVVGGSAEYTGAPFYAGISALKIGADLAFVFCENSAATAIKCYSPELIVSSFYSSNDEDVCSVASILDALPRLHALIIGPGLGRSEKVLSAMEEILPAIKARNLPLVIDADALFFLSNQWRLSLIKGYKRCILTPNKAEFERLVQVVIHQPDADPELKDVNHAVQLGALCRTLGVTILLKGRYDLISDGEFTVQVEEEGSPRRCGGQGDVLAGALAVTSHWSFQSATQGEFPDFPPQLWAGVLASAVTRRAAQSAFSLKKRSTTTPDIISELGAAFESIIPSQF